MTHEFDRAKVIRDEDGSWLCLHVKNGQRVEPHARSLVYPPGETLLICLFYNVKALKHG